MLEAYQLVSDAQEGFLKNWSTKKPLAKLKWMSEDQQQRVCIVLQLDMDLANEFNDPNHCPIIQIIENHGFQISAQLAASERYKQKSVWAKILIDLAWEIP